MLSIMNSFFDIGADTSKSTYLQLKIRLCNQISLIVIVTSIIYALAGFLLFQQISVYPVSAIGISFMVIVFNYLGLSNISRLVLSSGALSIVYLYHSNHVPSGGPIINSIYFLEFALAIIPWLLFDLREKLFLFTAVGFSMLLLIGQSYGINVFENSTSSVFFTDTILNELTYAFASLIIVLSLYFFQKKNYYFEMNNLKLIQEINFKNTELIASNAKLNQEFESRVTSEKALKESEEKFRTFIEQSEDGIILTDAESEIMIWNNACEEIFEVGQQQAVGRYLNEVVSAFQLLSQDQIELQGFKSNQPNTMLNSNTRKHISEIQCKTASGKVKDIEVSTFMILVGSKKVAGRICRDITEKKTLYRQLEKHQAVLENQIQQKTEELRESEQYLAEIAENIQDAILFWSFEEGRLYSNSTFEMIVERSIREEGIKPNVFLQWIADEDRDWVTKKINDLHQNPVSNEIDIQFRINTPTQKIKWIWLREQKVKSQANKYPRYITIITDITEMKRIEHELNVKTQRLESYEKKVKDLFQIMREGFVHTDLKGKFIESNLAFSELTGYSEKELQQMNFNHITPEKYHDYENTTAIKQVLDKGYSEAYFKEYKHKDGTLIPVEIQVYIAKENNQPSGMWGIVRDLRQKYKYEHTIRQQERYFTLVIDNLPLGIVLLDMDENIISLNKEFITLFGYNSVDITNLEEWFTKAFPDQEYRHQQDKLWKIAVNRQQEGIKIKPLNVKIRCKNQAYKHTETWITVLDDRIFVMYNDVTGKYIAQQKTRESRNMLQTVLDAIPVRVFWKDINLNYLGCNQQFANDAQLESPEDIIGKNDFDLVWIKNAELYQSVDKEVIINQKGVYNFEEPQVDLQGNQKWLKTSKIPLKNSENEIMGVLGVYEDITGFKKYEEELTIYRKKLEHLVEERTQQLKERTEKLENSYQIVNEQNQKLEDAFKKLKETQSQLIQSEKMASIGLLTAGIAHEINNPINFISSGMHGLKPFLEDIQQLLLTYEKLPLNGESGISSEIKAKRKDINYDQLFEGINSIIKNIDNGINRTIEIIKSLRNFTRTNESDLLIVNVHESIDSTLVLLHNHYKNRIKIVKNYGKIPDIQCYPSKLNQVIMNILTNAIQAINKQGIITISTSASKNEQVKISISDTGDGIEPENIKHIFEPFFTTKKIGQGTGLGLSISYSIVKQHHGEIIVESQPGEGTVFSLILPVKQDFN